MSERKVQTRYIPLRVRFRPASEYADREQGVIGAAGARSTQPLAPDLSRVSERERRAQQIKGLLRLCDLLRADLELDEVLQRIAASIATCTGFRALAINLIDEDEKMLVPVAFAGITEEHQGLLIDNPFAIEVLLNLMRPQFRISQSYFIPHEHIDLYADVPVVLKNIDKATYAVDDWHSEDSLIVPLYSLREQKLLGHLSLDDPEDGKVPTQESIEMVELFANKAALAIDNARIFREREQERVVLEQALAFLCEDIKLLRQGDLRQRVRSTHSKLQPLVDTVNEMVEEVSVILDNVQLVSLAVDKHTYNVQSHSEKLVGDTNQQSQEVSQVSQVIGEIAEMMYTISERTSLLSKTAVEAVDVTIEAQSTVDRAVEGMSIVREATMQSARTMKTLSESGQEINETVLTMTDLTTRMHLLALNAAIEATRAGEQGRGFSVIAHEVRTLAVQSAEASRKVSGYIHTIQQEAISVSQSVEQSTQQVIIQTELVTQTGVALEAISIVMGQLTNLVQGICNASESQSQGLQLAVSAINEIFRMRSDITGHMQHMQQSMMHLVELTNALRSRTAHIHIRER